MKRKTKRWFAHDSVVYLPKNRHHDFGSFDRYLGGGRALVLLHRAGYKNVDIKDLKKPNERIDFPPHKILELAFDIIVEAMDASGSPQTKHSLEAMAHDAIYLSDRLGTDKPLSLGI